MNIIIAIITITFIFYWLDYLCNYETYSNEGVQNLNKIYNKKKLIINNLNIKDNLSVKGDLECNGNGTFGNAKIGNWDKNTDYAVFSHKNRTGNNYGILQNDKNTYVNSTADGSVFIRNNNSINNIEVNKDKIKFRDKQFNLEQHDYTLCTYPDGYYYITDTGYDNTWIPTISSQRGYFYNKQSTSLFHYDNYTPGTNSTSPSNVKDRWIISACPTMKDDGTSTCQGDVCSNNVTHTPGMVGSLFIPSPIVSKIDKIQIT